MIRLKVERSHGCMRPSLTASIRGGVDALECPLALITQPITKELVDALRNAAKEADEALEAWEEARRLAA